MDGVTLSSLSSDGQVEAWRSPSSYNSLKNNLVPVRNVPFTECICLPSCQEWLEFQILICHVLQLPFIHTDSDIFLWCKYTKKVSQPSHQWPTNYGSAKTHPDVKKPCLQDQDLKAAVDRQPEQGPLGIITEKLLIAWDLKSEFKSCCFVYWL